jgi:hypothetical protein
MCGALAGCANKNLSEDDVLSQLRAAGLTVERLEENLITYEQLQRIEAETVTVFSVHVSDAAGQGKSITLVQFDRDWKAAAVGDEGVPGFAVRNWFFVGAGINQQLRTQIEAALL